MHQANSNPQEAWDIKLMRMCLQRWPFRQGKGILLRLFRPWLRQRDFIMEVEPGVIIPADLTDYMILYYFASSFCAQPAVQLAKELIHPGDNVIDIGANIGLWSLVAGRCVGPQGKVFALEPVPSNIVRLRVAVHLNEMIWVVCQQLAISDHMGSTMFYASTTGNSALGSLAQRKGVDSPLKVRTTTLDGFCEAKGLGKPQFLKVDVEGAEAQVFRGGTRTLEGGEAPVIQFEACDALLRHFGSDTVAVKRSLVELGYKIFCYNGRFLTEVSVDQFHEFDDLFALKLSHFSRTPFLLELLQSSPTDMVF